MKTAKQLSFYQCVPVRGDCCEGVRGEGVRGDCCVRVRGNCCECVKGECVGGDCCDHVTCEDGEGVPVRKCWYVKRRRRRGEDVSWDCEVVAVVCCEYPHGCSSVRDRQTSNSTYTYTHSHTLTLTHSHTHSHSHTHTLTLTHTHSLTHSHTHTHSLTHTHTHTHTHTQRLHLSHRVMLTTK